MPPSKRSLIPGHLTAAIDGGKLAERDLALRRALHRTAEELAAGQVRPEGVDPHRASLEREPQIGALADDARLRGLVEPRRDALHALLLCRPVEQHRAVEQVRKCLRRHACFLRQSRRRVLAREPGDGVVHHSSHGGSVGGLQCPDPVGLDADDGARVVGSRDEEDGVDRLQLVDGHRGGCVDQVERRLGKPGRRRDQKALEGDAQERVRAAAREHGAHLLEQRPCLRIAADGDLPTGLDAEAAVDDQLGVGSVARVGHAPGRYRSPSSFAYVSA